MSVITLIKCDGCNREFRDPPFHGWAPDGGFTLDGVFGAGEPYDRYHVCSLECLELFVQRQRARVLTSGAS